jgi:hypothetical protein
MKKISQKLGGESTTPECRFWWRLIKSLRVANCKEIIWARRHQAVERHYQSKLSLTVSVGYLHVLTRVGRDRPCQSNIKIHQIDLLGPSRPIKHLPGVTHTYLDFHQDPRRPCGYSKSRCCVRPGEMRDTSWLGTFVKSIGRLGPFAMYLSLFWGGWLDGALNFIMVYTWQISA